MKKLALAVAIVSLGAVGLITTAIAKNGHGGGNGHTFSARLTGYEEIIPGATPSAEGGAVSTTGQGSFRARVKDNPLRIEYRLRYSDLEGATTLFAHIHFGQRHTVGGVSAFLCADTNTTNQIPNSCPAKSGTVEGTIVAADVIGPAGQGIAAGELTELIRALRHRAAYVNVHTTGPAGTNFWPSGEIRGQIDNGRHFGFFRGKGKHKDDDD